MPPVTAAAALVARLRHLARDCVDSEYQKSNVSSVEPVFEPEPVAAIPRPCPRLLDGIQRETARSRTASTTTASRCSRIWRGTCSIDATTRSANTRHASSGRRRGCGRSMRRRRISRLRLQHHSVVWSRECYVLGCVRHCMMYSAVVSNCDVLHYYGTYVTANFRTREAVSVTYRSDFSRCPR